MRYIEVRRHTMRQKPGTHLTQEGVDLARKVGETMGPFARVVTSKSPRAYETAYAMGFAVDERAKELSLMTGKAGKYITEPTTFAEYANAMQKHKTLAKWGKQQSKFWRSIAQSLQDGESALLVSHGGMMEVGTLAAVPNANHNEWGAGLGYCEGVCLAFDGNDFVSAEILRVAGSEPAEPMAELNETEAQV